MKIIISPAKKLDTSVKVQNSKMNTSFLSVSTKLIQILKGKSISELKDLMGLSDNLAQLNWQRFQDWDIENRNTYKAFEKAIEYSNKVAMSLSDLFCVERHKLHFLNLVKNKLDITFANEQEIMSLINAKNFNKSDNDFAQNNLRILSGLYGILKPNDLILPYRLEMGTKLKTIKGNNLYRFWLDKLYQNIGEELNNEVLINLASNEYSKVLKLNKIKSEVITPVFKDYKNGKLKVISFYAKKARGLMTRFLIDNDIKSSSDIENFHSSGYMFSKDETVNPLEPVFVR